MFSTPLISCSRGAATVSEMTLGVAPAYVVRTTTVGGTTSGYSEIGSLNMQIAPTIKVITDKTAANTGRSMKKWANFIGESLAGLLFCINGIALALFRRFLRRRCGRTSCRGIETFHP